MARPACHHDVAAQARRSAALILSTVAFRAVDAISYGRRLETNHGADCAGGAESRAFPRRLRKATNSDSPVARATGASF
jgi:hypothetical protein